MSRGAAIRSQIPSVNLIAGAIGVWQVKGDVVTGGGGLPERPGDGTISPYPTGEVRSVAKSSSKSRAFWVYP